MLLTNITNAAKFGRAQTTNVRDITHTILIAALEMWANASVISVVVF